MSESNRQPPPEDDWTKIIQSIDWRKSELILHGRTEDGNDISVNLPTLAEIAAQQIRLPDNTLIEKDEEDRIVKRILQDGSITDFIYESLSKIPSKISLTNSNYSSEFDYSAYSQKDGELNFSFQGSMTEANIFHHKAIKGILHANIELFDAQSSPVGVVLANGTAFEYGFPFPIENTPTRELIHIEQENEIRFVGKLNDVNRLYQIAPDLSAVEIGSTGDENIHFSVPETGVKVTLIQFGSSLKLTNNGKLPVNIFRKGGRKISLAEGGTQPLICGDRLQFGDAEKFVDIERIGNSFHLSGGKVSNHLQKETPYIVTNLRFSVGNFGTDYAITNIAGAKVDISPVLNSLSEVCAEIHNSGTKPIRIGRGKETLLLSPGERAGIEDDDLLSYDLDTKLRVTHSTDKLILEMVPFRDKTAGAKMEVDELEAHLLKTVLEDGISESNLIRRHLSDYTLETLGFIRMYLFGAVSNEELAYFVHENTKMEVVKLENKITQISFPAREKTGSPSLSELQILIDWRENHVSKVSVTCNNGIVDILQHLISGGRQKFNSWKGSTLEADDSLPAIPDGQILLAKCIKSPDQLNELDIPSRWSDDLENVCADAYPDGKIIYAILPTKDAEKFKCVLDDRTFYILSISDLNNQIIKEHIASPGNINNKGNYWLHTKERQFQVDTKAGFAITSPQLLRSTNIDITRFGLIIRNDESSNSTIPSFHPEFCLSRPGAKHRISFGQQLNAGFSKNCEILIGNAYPNHFDLILDQEGLRLVKSNDVPDYALKIIRDGKSQELQTFEQILLNGDKIVVIRAQSSENTVHIQDFSLQMDSQTAYLQHISSLIKTASVGNYLSSLNPRFVEFRTTSVIKENVRSKLTVETLLFKSKPSSNFESDSFNDLDFNPPNSDNPLPAEISWLDDPDPFLNDIYCLIHHKFYESDWGARVVFEEGDIFDISESIGLEKIAFLRSSETEEGLPEHWLINPYNSKELLLLRKDELKSVVVEGGPETKINHGDTFFIRDHAFTLASVEEFEYLDFFKPRLIEQDNSTSVPLESNESINLSDLPLASIEADAYVLPINIANTLLAELPPEIINQAKIRIHAGEMVVPIQTHCFDENERAVYFTRTNDVSINQLLLTIMRRAEEENKYKIAIPIIYSGSSGSGLYDVLISYITAAKSAIGDVFVHFSICDNPLLMNLLKNEADLQLKNPAYSSERIQLIKHLDLLKQEIEKFSGDNYVPLDVTSSLANTVKNLKSSLEKIDFSIVEPLDLVQDLNLILKILGLAHRFSFNIKKDHANQIQLFMSDKYSSRGKNFSFISQTFTVFVVNTKSAADTSKKEAEADSNTSENSLVIPSSEGLDAAMRMRDFLGAEQARKTEERITVETEGRKIDGTVILRLKAFNIAIVKLDEPKSNLDTIEIPSWKNYSDLPIFHYGGRSYRYKLNGTVFTAMKGKIEIAADLQAVKESASGQSP